MTQHLSISLLGPLEVRLSGELVGDFEYTKVRALLAYLAVEAARPHTRAYLCALLWPDLPDAPARQNLSQALSRLRTVLGDRGASVPFLLTTAETVQLNPAASWTGDVQRFAAQLAAAEAHAHRSWRVCPACSARLRAAVSLYQGDFLTQFYVGDSALFEEWALLLREQYRQRMLSALERLAKVAEWRGDYAEAIETVRRRTQMEPLRDEPHAELMRLLALSGQTAAALAHYAYFQRTLTQELDELPEPGTTALYEQIRAGSLEPLRPTPPLHAVPALPSPLIGREAELAKVTALLRESTRLLTITGAPGIGKTRLALAVAERLHYEFEDGICFVDLAPLRQVELVPAAVADALGVKERAGQALSETLAAALKERHLLLVLDNFEHVAAAAPFAASLLGACPAVKLLVTSRAPLHVRAEQQFGLGTLAEAEAVALFRERAVAAGAILDAGAASDAVVGALCRQLDNLPLGIELLAGRARAYSPAELLAQLGPRLEAAAPEVRDLPPRQTTLRAAIAWSFDRLERDEQLLFARLGVFAGGCTVEAARAVAGPDAGEHGQAITRVLAALVEASLVQAESGPEGTRYSLLETIREFARERLATEEDAGAHALRRHADYYAALAQQAGEGLLGPEGSRWSARVAAEQDNLRAAFDYALEHGKVEAALELATGVWRFHWMRGLLGDGLSRLERALAAGGTAPLALQSAAMRAAGTLALGQGDFARARRWLEQAVATGRALPDGRLAQAALTNLGFALLEQGDADAALPCLEESIALAQRDANPYTVKFPTSMLGYLHLRRGDFERARAYYEESLRLNEACQDAEGTADALCGLGRVASAQGDRLTARQLGEAALQKHASLQHQLGLGQAYALLANAARDDGDYAAAFSAYRRCLVAWADRENVSSRASVYEDIARTLGLVGEAAAAVRLMGGAAALRARAGIGLTAHEQAAVDEALAAFRATLGDEAFAALWAARVPPMAAEVLAMFPPADG
jgi:predicted ATPase/DNA-binding SARP family transcriptional activator